jgi:hypothetical protein
VLGTFYWMRSDQAFDAHAFEELLTPEAPPHAWTR